jgi:hypothetical protein
MRYVELFRHADNDGDALTQAGIAVAEAIHQPAEMNVRAARTARWPLVTRSAAGSQLAGETGCVRCSVQSA